jgi:hypothetical protein
MYLANGDVLLSGAKLFDPEKPGRARSEDAELWILDKSFTKPPTRLGEKCSEGPAPSRKRMHIAWTIVANQYPEKLAKGQSQIWTADVEYENGKPHLINKKLALDSISLPFKCTLECQNFRPPDEKELTFSAYGYQGTDVCGVNLETGKVTIIPMPRISMMSPRNFPDGQYTLVECDHQVARAGIHRYLETKTRWQWRDYRLTYFSDTPGCKASNPVVTMMGSGWRSDGVNRSWGGAWNFLYDLSAAPKQ